MSRDYRTSVYLPQDLLWLARYKFGDDFNLSSFVRQALTALVSDGERVETPMAAMVRAAVEQARSDLQAQRKITEDTEAHQRAAREYVENRQAAIHDATTRVLLQVRGFDRYLPENDVHGDYADALDTVISQVSQLSGYDVELADVLAAYRELKAGADTA